MRVTKVSFDHLRRSHMAHLHLKDKDFWGEMAFQINNPYFSDHAVTQEIIQEGLGSLAGLVNDRFLFSPYGFRLNGEELDK